MAKFKLDHSGFYCKYSFSWKVRNWYQSWVLIGGTPCILCLNIFVFFFSLSHFQAFRNAFQWQKTRFVKKDLILPSAIFYCVQFHTPNLHTYIQLECAKTKQSEFYNFGSYCHLYQNLINQIWYKNPCHEQNKKEIRVSVKPHLKVENK